MLPRARPDPPFRHAYRVHPRLGHASLDDACAPRLVFLSLNPMCSMRDFAEGLGISSPSATQLVDTLVQFKPRRTPARSPRTGASSGSSSPREATRIGQESLDRWRDKLGAVLNALSEEEQQGFVRGIDLICADDPFRHR